MIRRKDKSLSQTQKGLGLESVGSISKSAEQKGRVFIFTIIKLTTYNIKEYQDYKPLNIHQVAGNPGVEFS